MLTTTLEFPLKQHYCICRQLWPLEQKCVTLPLLLLITSDIFFHVTCWLQICTDSKHGHMDCQRAHGLTRLWNDVPGSYCLWQPTNVIVRKGVRAYSAHTTPSAAHTQVHTCTYGCLQLFCQGSSCIFYFIYMFFSPIRRLATDWYINDTHIYLYIYI